MTIRQLNAGEIAAFLSFPGTSETTERSVYSMLDDGWMRTEWCFMARDGDRAVARVGFWAQPSSPADINPYALWLPWEDDFLTLGRELLNQSLAVMRRQGARTINCHISSKSSTHQKQRLLYESCGLEMIQEKSSFIRENVQPLPDDSDRIILKSRLETGDETFISAIEKVSVSTLDRAHKKDILEKGPVAAAVAYFDSLRGIIDDDKPSLWMLGHDNTGALIGLVVPQIFDIVPQLYDEMEGAINYIGVVSEQRGKGYVNDLLRAGVKLLQQKGTRRILADIDTQNTPMINAAISLGFKRQDTYWVYNAGL